MVVARNTVALVGFLAAFACAAPHPSYTQQVPDDDTCEPDEPQSTPSCRPTGAPTYPIYHPSNGTATTHLAPYPTSTGSGKPPKSGTAGTKLAIYWGAEDDSTTLDDVCADSSYDIVNLAFLSYFGGAGGYPTLSIGSLNGPSDAQKSAGATSLQDASSLVPAVKACQEAGKLVILSAGGANDFADVKLGDDSAGEKLADQLWNLFLGGSDDAELRPFGDLKLDGIDFDNESADSTGYSALATKLRSNFAGDSSKQYYLTAAPQCPFPDASIPLDVCKQLDFVFVQFYNNGECNVAQSGFSEAVDKWSGGIGDAQLFIGGLASGSDGDQGYVDSATFASSLKDVQAKGLKNFGGAMLWEAQLAVKNGDYQKAIKEAFL